MHTTKKKIKISNDLFNCTISFLEDLDTDYFEPETMLLYGYILHALSMKKKAVYDQYISDSLDDDCYLEESVATDGNYYNEDGLPF